MKEIIEKELSRLACEGNLRKIPSNNLSDKIVDLSSNDYLGIAARHDLREKFMEDVRSSLPFSCGASRLLSSSQNIYTKLEDRISKAYGGHLKALLFNSGYHANSGIIPALSFPETEIIADKLVHASIIDGMKLGGRPFTRFKHNDVEDFEKKLLDSVKRGKKPLIVVESVYSMDGDRAPLAEIAAIKEKISPDGLLYVDEAHAVGVLGKHGLGLAKDVKGVDIIVGTFGKALGSYGAFAVVSPTLREWLVNRCRSLIFSTMVSPIQAGWTDFMFEEMMEMDSERETLTGNGKILSDILKNHGGGSEPSHIQPFILGDSKLALEFSKKLNDRGFNVLPIRRPTVPPGTERLRFSLSAAISERDLERLDQALNDIVFTFPRIN